MSVAVANAAAVDRKGAIRSEVRSRLLAERNFLDYCRFIDPRYPAGARHIRLMASKLEQVAKYITTGGAEGIGRLMIFMPPRYWKSQTASRHFPAWLLGKDPDLPIILTSYGADLATKHSKAVRDAMESERYSVVFGELSSMSEPTILDPDSRSSAAWEVRGHRGGMIAAGVGGAITGFGAKLFLCDDPFKNRDEADSPSRREYVYEWYRSTAYTRLEDHAAAVLIMTRWHAEDLGGKLLQAMAQEDDADDWEVLFLPAIALGKAEHPQNEQEFHEQLLNGLYIPMKQDQLGRRQGEPLWPEKDDLISLRKKRANMRDYDFMAQFQQMPFWKEGARYKREWIKVITKLPDGVTLKAVVRYWDKANSAAGDYTAGVAMGYGSDGNFYVLDVARKQGTAYERDQLMKRTAEADVKMYGGVKIWHQQDPGSAGKDSAEATNRALMGYNPRFETMSGDKETRSEPLESAFQGGMVYLLKGAWNEPFIEECVSFPRGKYDDQVDAGSSAYSKLLEMIKRGSREVRSYEG